MRHQISGKNLSRNANQRKNLIRGLITSLVLDGHLITTQAKAKVLKRSIDKMFTSVRRIPALTAKRLFAFVPNKKVVDKIISDILPVIEKEKSGLTKLTKVGVSLGDQSPKVLIEWKISPKETALVIPKKEKLVKEKNEK